MMYIIDVLEERIEMIDITKEYRTKSGKRVINLQYVPFNSAGHKVTYPIKGLIVEKEKPFTTQYYIWSENGIADVVFGKHEGKNLEEVK